MSFYFITGNKNKFEEVQRFFPHIEQLNIDLPELQDSDAHNVVRAKLVEAFKHKDGEFMIEDTSLYFDCLNGLPGPFIKWFIKAIGTNGLAEMANKLENNKATGKTIIGYAKNSKEIEFFDGEMRGAIVAPRGESGFGWDPIFQPDGHTKTYGEMNEQEKSAMSMRAVALEKLKEFLENK